MSVTTDTIIYTAGEVARHLKVAPRTACRLIDDGKLKGYRLPTGGRDRRVSHESLVAFIREHGMPESMIPQPAAEKTEPAHAAA